MARRPKYEVMGLHDMSYGLTEANVRPTSLTWVGDEAHFRAYHRLEDVYDQFRLFLRSARVVRHRVADDHAWWIITDGLRLLSPAPLARGRRHRTRREGRRDRPGRRGAGRRPLHARIRLHVGRRAGARRPGARGDPCRRPPLPCLPSLRGRPRARAGPVTSDPSQPAHLPPRRVFFLLA